MADTDSVRFVVDSGTNRMIVNDIKLLTKYIPGQGKIKGMNGNLTISQGGGLLNLPLKSDQGRTHMVKNLPAVYVPSCPYNLLSPQYLIKEMRQRGFKVQYFKHDDQKYIFQYCRKDSTQSCTLTCPIRENDLFEFRTRDGYDNFRKRVANISPEWTALYGGDIEGINTQHEEANVASNDEASIGTPTDETINQTPHLEHDGSTSLSNDKAKESRQQTREVTREENQTASSKRRVPMVSTFDHAITCKECTNDSEDPNIALLRRKQLRLLTIHEKLGHLSFSVLKLLAKVGIIPKDLADVDPPLCPGCAYGKAHRKPWRYKGKKNRRKLREAKAPGEVISIDQLVSPTPGFIPLHREVK